MVTAAMKLEDACSMKESYDKPRQHIKKQRHHFGNKGPYSQSYGFYSGHVWMWKLDHKEGWALKNWCFQIVVLEKTLGSPLDCKEVNLINPKGSQPWIFIGKTDSEAEVPIIWPPDAKNWLIRRDSDAGKDWGQEEKGTKEGEVVGWQHRLNEHEFVQIQEIVKDSEAWRATFLGSQVLDMTSWMNNKNIILYII